MNVREASVRRMNERLAIQWAGRQIALAAQVPASIPRKSGLFQKLAGLIVGNR